MKKEKDGWKFVQMNEKKNIACSLQRIMAALLALPHVFQSQHSGPQVLTWAAMAALVVGGNLKTWKSWEGCHYPTPNSTFVTFGV
jgi:hypothetical protein